KGRLLMPLPHRVGILGGGRMGAGIAHAFAIRGSDVTLVEQHEDAARAARERVRSSVAKSIERGLEATTGEVLQRVRLATDASGLAGVDLAIEAVPEDLDLKRTMLARLEAHLRESAVLASNTSSISIGSLAAGLTKPERFLGLHFFNP